MSDENILSDFLKNPSNASKQILKIAKVKQNEYDLLLKRKGFLTSIISGVKIRLWYMDKYLEIYKFIQIFQINPKYNIEELFNDLADVFEQIALNNLLLTYASLIEKESKSNIETKEDLKLKYLSMLYNNTISKKQFDDKFGHHCINPFELKSKRFSEMTNIEINNIAILLKRFKQIKKGSLKEQIQNNPKNKFAIYSALREELKDCALKIISGIRFKCLKLQKVKKIKNIFELNYKEIIQLENGS